MAKRKTKDKPLKWADYPLIGYEYEYLGQPVRLTRVCPSRIGGPDHSHIEFENRFCDRSSCDAGELGEWQDIDKPLSQGQSTLAMLNLQDAIENATTDDERTLAEWQLRRLKQRKTK
jgi:hypothetical protein